MFGVGGHFDIVKNDRWAVGMIGFVRSNLLTWQGVVPANLIHIAVQRPLWL